MSLREAAQQALEALTSRDGDSWTRRFARDRAIEALEAALAEPTQSQQLAAAGFTPRDRRLECDECGGRFTRQMLPIHKCAALAEPVQEPVAWMEGPFGELRRNLAWRLDPMPPQTVAWSIPLYLAQPQRKPLTDEEIVDAVREADLDWHSGWTLDEHEPNRFTTLVRAIERAHGIGEQK